jgi:hypothetical protein
MDILEATMAELPLLVASVVSSRVSLPEEWATITRTGQLALANPDAVQLLFQLRAARLENQQSRVLLRQAIEGVRKANSWQVLRDLARAEVRRRKCLLTIFSTEQGLAAAKGLERCFQRCCATALWTRGLFNNSTDHNFHKRKLADQLEQSEAAVAVFSAEAPNLAYECGVADHLRRCFVVAPHNAMVPSWYVALETYPADPGRVTWEQAMSACATAIEEGLIDAVLLDGFFCN